MSLNDKIVSYLKANNIAFVAGDYVTQQPEGQTDQIAFWNAAKLGAQPSQATIDAAPSFDVPFAVSKLTIRQRIRAAGLESAFNTALAGLSAAVKNDYTDAIYILSNDAKVISFLQSIAADPAIILAGDPNLNGQAI